MFNGKLMGLLSKVFGILGVLIVIAMVGTLYDSNTAIADAITAAVNAASFLILPDILPFGIIIILLGLLFSQIWVIWRGSSGGIISVIAPVLSVVGVVMVLGFFPTIIDSLDDALTIVIAAGDDINELFLGTIVPLLIYLMVAAGSVATPAVSYARSRRSSKRRYATAGAF